MAPEKKCKSWRWYIRPINRSHQQNGEFSSLVLPMRDIDEEKHGNISECLLSICWIAPSNSPSYWTRSDSQWPNRHAALSDWLSPFGFSQMEWAIEPLQPVTSFAQPQRGTLSVKCPKQYEYRKKKTSLLHTLIKQNGKALKGIFCLWNFPNCLLSIDGKDVRVV